MDLLTRYRHALTLCSSALFLRLFLRMGNKDFLTLSRGEVNTASAVFLDVTMHNMLRIGSGSITLIKRSSIYLSLSLPPPPPLPSRVAPVIWLCFPSFFARIWPTAVNRENEWGCVTTRTGCCDRTTPRVNRSSTWPTFFRVGVVPFLVGIASFLVGVVSLACRYCTLVGIVPLRSGRRRPLESNHPVDSDRLVDGWVFR